MKSGVELIAEERQRQIEVEGWTPEHDDKYHGQGELALAASCYALADDPDLKDAENPPHWWPWERQWWKPKDDPIRNLARAGALIAAEIDRMQRAAGVNPKLAAEIARLREEADASRSSQPEGGRG